jgi:hypothetical protein
LAVVAEVRLAVVAVLSRSCSRSLPFELETVGGIVRNDVERSAAASRNVSLLEARPGKLAFHRCPSSLLILKLHFARRSIEIASHIVIGKGLINSPR